MIDIDKIFCTETNNTHNTHNNINITNPILYIFVGGNGTEILKSIYDFNEDKQLNTTGAVEYINIGTEFCNCTNNNNVLISECEEENFMKRRKIIYEDFKKCDDILKMVSYIELKFLERSYIMPIRRRVHFIVEASNEYSCILAKVIDVIEKFMLSRNLAPVIDIFAIIDDKPDNPDTKNAATYTLLQELKEIENNINMIYLLSNLNSSRTISNQNEIYTSIARTSLIKDFDYNEQPYDYSYNERKIIENAKNISQEKKGIFYSLGLKTIERPKDVLQFIALNIVIDRNDFTNKDIIDECTINMIDGFLKILNNITKNTFIDDSFMQLQHINGIMIENNYDIYETNIEMITNCFHKNLDKYFEYNLENNLSFDKYKVDEYINQCFENYISNPNIGYFSAVDILKKANSKLYEIKDNLLKSVYEIQIKFDNWKDKQFNYKKKFFDDKNQPIFDIASEYINCLYKLFIPNMALEAYENFKTKVEKLIYNADLLEIELKSSQKKLIDMAEARLTVENYSLIKIRFIDYYKSIIKKNIEKNYNDYFENIYSKILDLTKEDINIFYTECFKYINKFILHSSEFNLTVYDEISNRLLDDNKGEYNEHSVNDLFNKEITDDKFYFIKLINEKNFYSNICVLTDNNSIINKISNSDINYIVYDGEAKLEILYFIGTFSEESLAYDSIYKSAYSKLNILYKEMAQSEKD